MELIKKTIKITPFPQKLNSPALMEGDLIVPDVKPDMEEIISHRASGFITNAEIMGNKINFKGKLKLSVLYIPKGDEKTPQPLRTELAINDFITAEGLENAKLLNDGFEITDSNVTILSDRKYKYTVNINLSFLKLTDTELDVITDINDLPPDCAVKSAFTHTEITEAAEEAFSVSEDFTLPADKGEIGEIIDIVPLLQGVEGKLSGEKLSVSGDLALQITYMPKGEAQIEILDIEMPINGAFETSNKDKNAACSLKLLLGDITAAPKEDEDGEARILSCEANLSAAYKIQAETETPYIKDIYAPGKKAETKTETVSYPKFICRNKNQFPVKETINIDEAAPQILRIYSVSCKALWDNLEEYEDKAVIEGVVEAKILYSAKDDDRPLYCYETMLPYRQTVELKGYKPNEGGNIDIDLNIEHISFSTLDSRELELKPVLSVCACAVKTETVSLMTDLTFSDLTPEELSSIASITLYIVKKGDTLWEIAKKYNTTISGILAVNPIETPDLIYPGDKIIIVKKIP